MICKKESAESNDLSEMLTQLKKKKIKKRRRRRSEKIMILTDLSVSWSPKKIQKEFGASDSMVRQLKSYLMRKELFQHKTLSQEKHWIKKLFCY